MDRRGIGNGSARGHGSRSCSSSIACFRQELAGDCILAKDDGNATLGLDPVMTEWGLVWQGRRKVSRREGKDQRGDAEEQDASNQP